MRFLLLLVLLISCGRKTVYTYPPMPKDQASPEVKAEIDGEIAQLQKEFDSLNVKIDLQKLPIVVSDLPFGVVGRCQFGKKNTGAYIILSPQLFPKPNDFVPLDAHLYEKDFVRVLIHEIGHCYFKRMHEKPAFLESPGNHYELEHEGTTVFVNRIPRSVMPEEAIDRMPKALRLYYLAEVAGKSRLNDNVSLQRFTEFRLRSNEPILDTVETTDKEGSDVPQLLKCAGTHHAP